MPDLAEQAPAVTRTIDPAIGQIVLGGCPKGHGGEGLTVSELYNDDETREYAEGILDNYDGMVEDGIKPEKALQYSVGALALKDKRGGYIYREPEVATATSPGQPEAEKK